MADGAFPPHVLAQLRAVVGQHVPNELLLRALSAAGGRVDQAVEVCVPPPLRAARAFGPALTACAARGVSALTTRALPSMPRPLSHARPPAASWTWTWRPHP